MKQAEGAREVLIVTGRGNKSPDGVPVVREAIRRLLGLLSTRGVVNDHSEHSPGSFAVRLAPLSALTSRATPNAPAIAETRVAPPTLDGLKDTTREQLRVLAEATLRALGIRDPSSEFVRDEMVRQCSLLAATIPPGAPTADERENRLRTAIERAIERLDEDHR